MANANIWYVATPLSEHGSDQTSRRILRDEKVYPDPEVFRPERFEVSVNGKIQPEDDPNAVVFGFGRR